MQRQGAVGITLQAFKQLISISGEGSQPAVGRQMPDLPLQKPCRAADLLNAIHSLLSRSE